MTKSGNYKAAFDKPFFKEFVVTSNTNGNEINEKLLEKKYTGRICLR